MLNNVNYDIDITTKMYEEIKQLHLRNNKGE